MNKITTVGVDLAKSVFSVHGVDADGRTVLRKTVRRAPADPKPESGQEQMQASAGNPLADRSLNHSAGAKQHRLRDLETQGLGGPDVDYQFVRVWAIDRQVCRASAAEDTIDVLDTTCDRPR